jgi:crotonobetainyl-CoA:carnitine CoA-transferase CaiB-like acyl-CoA transferase
MADPQLRHRAMFDDDPDSPRLGLPFTLPGTPAEESVVGAARGADTASILAELGLGDQIDRLRREGAV